MSVFSLRSINKEFNSKEKDLVRVFSKKSIILLDDGPRVISISVA